MTKQSRVFTVNAISLLRVPLALIFIFTALNTGMEMVAFSVVALVLAFFTDILDGVLARRWSITSKVGYIVDGLADRAMYLGIVIVAVVTRNLWPLAAFALVYRDIAMYACRATLPTWEEDINRTKLLSKLNALLFRVVLGLLLCVHYASSLSLTVSQGLSGLETATSIAVAAYLIYSYASLGIMIAVYTDPIEFESTR